MSTRIFNAHGVLTESRPGRFRELAARGKNDVVYGDYSGVGLTLADIATDQRFEDTAQEHDEYQVVVWEGQRIAGYLQLRRGMPTVAVPIEHPDEVLSDAIMPLITDNEARRQDIAMAQDEVALMQRLTAMPRESADRVINWAYRFWGDHV